MSGFPLQSAHSLHLLSSGSLSDWLRVTAKFMLSINSHHEHLTSVLTVSVTPMTQQLTHVHSLQTLYYQIPRTAQWKLTLSDRSSYFIHAVHCFQNLSRSSSCFYIRFHYCCKSFSSVCFKQRLPPNW